MFTVNRQWMNSLQYLFFNFMHGLQLHFFYYVFDGKYFRVSLFAERVFIDERTGFFEFEPIFMLNQGLGDENNNGGSIWLIGQLRLMQYWRESQNTDGLVINLKRQNTRFKDILNFILSKLKSIEPHLFKAWLYFSYFILRYI